MSPSKRINVMLADGADVDAVAARATAVGMHVEQALGAVGLLVGRIDESLLEQLRSLPEVASIEAEREIDIGPPDADTQ